MVKSTLLVALIAAAAQAQSPEASQPLVVLTGRDIHRLPVRFRPAGSTAPWTEGVALRRDRVTFSVVDSRGQVVFAPVAPPLRIEAFVAEHGQSDHIWKGALIGGAIGAGAVVLDAYTCKDNHSEGPPCGIVIVLTPVAASLGALIGGAIGAMVPSRDWQPVARFAPR